MRKLKTSDINLNTALPIKKGTLDHVQLSYQEGLAALARSVLGNSYDPTQLYVLFGCENTGSGLNYIIGAGAVFFNGEIYLVDAATFTAIAGQVAVGTITVTHLTAASADPVTFTDGSIHNVHEIRKIVFAAGASGSGDVDYSNIGSGWITTTGNSLATINTSLSGTFFNSIEVQTNQCRGYAIRRFKMNFNCSNGTVLIGFPLIGMVSDSYALEVPGCILTELTTPFDVTSNAGLVDGNILKFTLNLSLGTYVLTGQIIHKTV